MPPSHPKLEEGRRVIETDMAWDKAEAVHDTTKKKKYSSGSLNNLGLIYWDTRRKYARKS